MSVTGTAVVVGPRAVRSSTAMTCRTTELAAVALACIDDEFALVDDQPVAVACLWREVFWSLLDGCATAALIYPSWWSDQRIATVYEAARSAVPKVALACRAATLTSAVARRPSVVLEISESFVALSRPSDDRPVRAVSRAADPPAAAGEVTREVASLIGGGAVVVDCPDGLGGAPELGTLIADGLRAHGFEVAVVDDDRMLDAAEVGGSTADERPFDHECVVPASRPRRPRMWALAGGAVVGVLTVAIPVVGGPSTARSPATLLVEGRVVVEVPAAWTARRITAGPGSARVQVTSPADPHLALHVTQSPVPRGETLQRTTDTLRAAMLAAQPGVFADFNPENRLGDRPAVTYREVRDGHDIRWTVLLDGTVRISIGCQSPRGSEEAVRRACERAIASARSISELAGTVAPQRQSNNT